MKIVKKLKKFFELSDPYPNLGYEIACYVKGGLGMVFVSLGLFFILSPVLKSDLVFFGFAPSLGLLGEKILCWQANTFAGNSDIVSLIFGILFIFLGLYLFWQIKLVRKLIKEVRDVNSN